MKRSSITKSHRQHVSLSTLASLILFAAAAYGEPEPVPASGVQIKWTAPDGRVMPMPAPSATNKESSASRAASDTLSCPLREGRTTFVIKLPETPARDRITFVNENAAAAGEMSISVSNDPLPAASSKWVEVDGRVAFRHKRLFNVSMMGVDARYLRLSFDVRPGNRIAGPDALRTSASADENRQLAWLSQK